MLWTGDPTPPETLRGGYTETGGYADDHTATRAPGTRLGAYDAAGMPSQPFGGGSAQQSGVATVKAFLEQSVAALHSLAGGVGGSEPGHAPTYSHVEGCNGCPGSADSERGLGDGFPNATGSSAGCAEVKRQALLWVSCKTFGGVFLLFYAWVNLQLYWKFTPVYTPVACGHQAGTLDDLQMSTERIHVGLKISVQCKNPNPYTIVIVGSTPGRVYIGPLEDKLETGNLTVMPGSNMTERGNGTVHVTMDQTLYGHTAQLLVHHMLYDDSIPVWMELQFDAGVYMNFGLRSWGAAMPYKKLCGMKVGGMLVPDQGAKSRLGPLVCGETFEDLVVPPVGAEEYETDTGEMGFKASQVAPKEVEQGTIAKNMSLGIVIIGSLLGSAVLLTLQVRSVFGNSTTKHVQPSLAGTARSDEEGALMPGDPGSQLSTPHPVPGNGRRDHDQRKQRSEGVPSRDDHSHDMRKYRTEPASSRHRAEPPEAKPLLFSTDSLPYSESGRPGHARSREHSPYYSTPPRSPREHHVHPRSREQSPDMCRLSSKPYEPGERMGRRPTQDGPHGHGEAPMQRRSTDRGHDRPRRP